MNLLELLANRLGESLNRAGIISPDYRDRTDWGYEPDDFLIRQRIKHWAGHQNVPGQSKLRLLQAAALQKDLPVTFKEKTNRKIPRHYPPEPWGQEFLPSYLAIAFQYNHVRLIA